MTYQEIVTNVLVENGVTYQVDQEQNIIKMIHNVLKDQGYGRVMIRNLMNQEDFIPDVLGNLPN